MIQSHTSLKHSPCGGREAQLKALKPHGFISGKVSTSFKHKPSTARLNIRLGERDTVKPKGDGEQEIPPNDGIETVKNSKDKGKGRADVESKSDWELSIVIGCETSVFAKEKLSEYRPEWFQMMNIPDISVEPRLRFSQVAQGELEKKFYLSSNSRRESRI